MYSCTLFTLLSIFLLNCIPAVAQTRISGRVLNDATGLPVAGASVYFNNTAIGTSTDDKGAFYFHSISLVNTELIVSNIGFEPIVFKPDAATAPGKLFIFRLQKKEQQLREVLVLADLTKKRWLEIFKGNFLGISEEADRSTISNMPGIYFTRGEDQHTFNAYSDTPLIITNRMLGYKVHFQLMEFSFNEKTGRTYFFGFTRYEELGDRRSWQRNRRRAYLGSSLHFYKSLIKNQLAEAGFDTYIVKSMDSNKSQSAISMAAPVAAAQIMTVDTGNDNYYRVTLNGKLMVQYKKEPAGKAYLSRKTLLQGNVPGGFRSFIHPNKSYFLLDKNGIVTEPLAVEYSGFWIYEKAANMLPYDYVPDQQP